MRLIKLVIVLGLIGSVVSTDVRAAVGSAFEYVTHRLDIGSSSGASGEETYDSLCPLFDGYLAAEGSAKQASAAAVTAAANGAAADGDTALQAILSVVPAALSGDASTDADSARALLARECDAHGHDLANI